MSTIPSTTVSLGEDVRRVLGSGTTGPVAFSDYYANAGTGFSAGVLGIPARGTPLSLGTFRGKRRPLPWAYSASDPVVAWIDTVNSALQVFAIAANPGDVITLEYAVTVNFQNHTPLTYVAVSGGVTHNGVTYEGYVRTPVWTRGNNNYQHWASRNGSAAFITYELTALANSAFPGPYV